MKLLYAQTDTELHFIIFFPHLFLVSDDTQELSLNLFFFFFCPMCIFLRERALLMHNRFLCILVSRFNLSCPRNMCNLESCMCNLLHCIQLHAD